MGGRKNKSERGKIGSEKKTTVKCVAVSRFNVGVRHINRQTGRQTERETDRDRQRQREVNALPCSI